MTGVQTCALPIFASLAHRYHMAAAEVAAVTVRLTSMSAWMVGNPAPTSIFEAKFSLPFAIATLLTAGRLGVAEYADRWLHDPRIRSLMGRVQLVADETLAADTALVAIHTHGGQRLEGAGTWRTLTLAEVEHKFQDVVGGLLGAGRAARLADLVDDLPRALHRPFFRSAREHICASTRVREHHDEACVPRRPRWQCEEAPRRCRVLSTTVGGMCPDRRLAHRGL